MSEEPELKPPVQRKPDKKRPGVSYPHRLLQALASVYEEEGATKHEKLQAVKMSLEAMKHRKKPKRKTDRDKEVIRALEKPSDSRARLEKPSPIERNIKIKKEREETEASSELDS